MNKKITPLLFPLFWIGLTLATYMNFFNIYIIGVLSLVLIKIFSIKRCSKSYRIQVSWWKLFVIYYFFISTIGVIKEYLDIKDLVEFIIKYICFPIIIINIIPKDKDDIKKLLIILKNIIFFAAIYGLIESIIKYNLLANIIVIENKSWIMDMNKLGNYQCSSFFLHYNYYGCILIVGWIIDLFYPYKKTITSNIYKVLIIEQIVVCQSRICWIAFAFLILYRMIKSKKINNRKIQFFIISMFIILVFIIFEPSFFNKFGTFFLKRFSRIWKYGFNDGSLGQRLGTLMNWPSYFKENIIRGIYGTGYQSVTKYYMQNYSFFKGYSTVDCEWTVFLVETGIVGFIIFLITIIKNFTKCNVEEIKKYIIIAFVIEATTLDLVANNTILVLIIFFIVYKYQNRYNYH